MATHRVGEDLEEEIASLGDLSRKALLERWAKAYGPEAPKGISQALMTRAIAYRLQAKHLGGLKAGVARQLRETLAPPAPETSAAASPSGPSLKPGARLLREWNGKTHHVEVTESGFLWNGAHYRSLSAIARAITGARWSGPRFFGLTGKRPS